MAHIEITLPEDQRAALYELSRLRNIPVEELVRKGIEEVLRSSRVRRDPEAKRRALEAIGKFKGPSDLSARHDDYFAEACEH